ncbi:MAG: hypothetical protein IJ356_08115 [Erysipelotrichaceae bacterium]|nr:hypothetical protein [Erysipelotrichaceae bacterium]
MQILFFILKQTHLLNDILHELAEAGVRGGTILDAKGMGESLANMEDIPMFGALRQLLSSEEKEQVKLLMCVAEDSEIVPIANTIKKVVDLSKPNTGIIFSLPVYYCEGLNKHYAD